MKLLPLRAEDAETLWHFEQDNRAFFESWINARPASFYTPEGFADELQQCLHRHTNGTGFHYLVWDGAELVGRINLTHVLRQHFHCASVGYRVAESAQGRGVAGYALAAVMHEAFHTHDLHRLEATARPENAASAHLLRKHGFVQFGHSRRSMELQGQWFDMLHFEAHAPESLGTYR